MRVLLTGASSFTGCWFARALIEREAEVTALLAGPRNDGRADRDVRLATLPAEVGLIDRAPFGTPAFLNAITRLGPFETACLHGSQVGDHRSRHFDVEAAVEANTLNADTVMARLADSGCRRMIVTGSVFEAGEGVGDGTDRSIGGYGEAKSRSSLRLIDAATARGLDAIKFTIANPFGPLEKSGFTTYLARTWLAGDRPFVEAPSRVRDNLHVDLLARLYARVATGELDVPGGRLAPSGYRETLLEFATRFGREIGERLKIPTPLAHSVETPADQPTVRVASDPIERLVTPIRYEQAWDRLAAFYAGMGRASVILIS
ncbi:MAG: NAD-dependent epimerase/dehydratase family protein [Geminicoccaceae bacterium]